MDYLRDLLVWNILWIILDKAIHFMKNSKNRLSYIYSMCAFEIKAPWNSIFCEK